MLHASEQYATNYEHVPLAVLQQPFQDAQILPDDAGQIYTHDTSLLRLNVQRATDGLVQQAVEEHSTISFPEETVAMKAIVRSSGLVGGTEVTLATRFSAGFTLLHSSTNPKDVPTMRKLLATIADVNYDYLWQNPEIATLHLTDPTNEVLYKAPADMARVIYAQTVYKMLREDEVVAPVVVRLSEMTDTVYGYGQAAPHEQQNYYVDLRRAAVVNHLSAIYRQIAAIYPDNPGQDAHAQYGYGFAGRVPSIGAELLPATIAAYQIGDKHPSPEVQIYAGYHPNTIQDLERYLSGPRSDWHANTYIGALLADDIIELVSLPLNFAQAFEKPF